VDKRGEQNVAAIAKFLNAEFPGLTVHHEFNTSRSAEYYRLDRDGFLAHRLLVSPEFLEDHPTEDLLRLMGEWNVVRTIGEAGPRAVLVTNGGVSLTS
jgi:hypothetical protein